MDAVYHPPESPQGRNLRDTVLAIDELMAAIFVQCLPLLSEDHYNYPSPHCAPLLLVYVCRRWRQVAVSTPALWKSFDVPFSFSSSRLFRLWMERSGVRPLSLSASHESLKAILPYSPRWEQVTLELEPESLTTLAAVKKHRSPLLRRLALRFSRSHMFALDEDEWSNTPATPYDVFEHAPNLRSVLIKYLPNIDLRLPSAQLTTLEVYGVVADQLVRLARPAINLTHLIITVRSIPSSVLELPRCTLAHLKFLSAHDHSSPSLTGRGAVCQTASLINLFSCPALEQLHMGTFPKLPESEHPAFKHNLLAFLERAPRVSALELDIPLNDDALLLAVLAHTPALEELKLARHRLFGAAFFRRLTYDAGDGAPPLCPRLRVFCVKDGHAVESPAALVEMVACRWRVADGAPVARLQRVAFDCQDERLVQFGAEGLALEVR
ncbi:hypothetical protein B0H11DRAFT_2226996 [Mycena galericulata]|nr:hypothetical protein B0H11DRAFT_2226996 [Mycena galericulata]